MLIVNCKGSPREIGHEHGSKAAAQIKSGIEYYKRGFVTTFKMEWAEVCKTALKFDRLLGERYLWLKEEMEAIAEGAGVGYSEILAINFRQEIIFGMYADDCTSIAWKTKDSSFLSQNWDWMTEQKDNIIVLNIDAPGKPCISMGTEAGIIGKIGLNSKGVGVCANGIRALGLDEEATPVHICRRLILESETRDDAIAKLEKYGTAAASYMVVGDPTGCVGLECTVKGIIKRFPDERGRLLHTNHLLEKHDSSVVDNPWVQDSPARFHRLTKLADQVEGDPTEKQISDIFKDEDGYPYSINRQTDNTYPLETLFNIVMNLTTATATLTYGRPSNPIEVVTLAPRKGD